MTMTVKAVHKPARTIQEAYATVQVLGEHNRDEVIDFGLQAMDESRQSLFGYGIRRQAGGIVTSDRVRNITIRVFAHRD